MAHIDLQNDYPGIRGPMAFSPQTAKPLNELAEILLRDDNNTLSRGERELIATYVSSLNDCFFCQNVHGGLAQHYFQCDTSLIDAVKNNFLTAAISDKIKALLAIAASVQQGGKKVTVQQIENAKAEGAQGKYYLSKNGRVYYRDAQNRPVWVTPPSGGIQVPADQAEKYQDFQGYNGRSTGRDLTDIAPQGAPAL